MNKDKWFGSTLETPGQPMIDAGMGSPMVLEVFEFAIMPNQQRRPTEQELFNSHWPHIKTLIWSKGLIQNEDVNPRVVIGKKRYRIFILCEPRFNKYGIKVVQGKPKSLQDIFNKLDKPMSKL